MSQRLAGKVALITGTGSGQGREAALRFTAEGAKVIGCDINVAAAEETLQMVHANGGQMISVQPVDLGEEEEVERLVSVAEGEYGGIDILYNNAGALRPGGHDMALEDFEFTMRNEVTIVWLMTKAAVPAFQRRGGGVIINTASVSATSGSGFVGNAPGMFAHSVAKAAVLRMSKVLSIELAAYNVRVNALLPGIVETDGSRTMLGAEDSAIRAAFVDGLLIKRVATVTDIVNAALFLASDEASYITGTTLVIDGGSEASGGMGLPKPELLEALGALFAAPV